MEKEYYVYVSYREDNDVPFYVGMGKGYRYVTTGSRNKKYKEIKQKFGAYSEKIIENLTEKEAFEIEQRMISEYSEKYELANITKGGGRGNPNYKHSEETKRKISEATKKQWANKESRELLIKSKNKGYIKNDKPKVKKEKKRKPWTEEQKRKLSESINNSTSKKRRIHNMSKYKNIHVFDLQDNLIGVFRNTREAIDYIESNYDVEIKIPNVIDVIKGKRKTCKGFKWKSIED